MTMKQDRYNFTMLGNYERQESVFRVEFKKKFNEVLSMLTRNDYPALKQTVEETEKTY